MHDNHFHLSYGYNGQHWFSSVSQVVEKEEKQTIYMLVMTQSLVHRNA